MCLNQINLKHTKITPLTKETSQRQLTFPGVDRIIRLKVEIFSCSRM